jgi:hypothetical protein
MKRKFIFVSATLVALVLFQTSGFRLQSHIVQPLTGGLAGDPGQTNCAACHSTYGAPTVRNSQFIIRIAPDSTGLANDSSIVAGGTGSLYTPNHPNWISFDLTGVNTNYPGGVPHYGFQFTALEASHNDSMAGSFSLIDIKTSMESGPYNAVQFPPMSGTISYVGHSHADTTHVWRFLWSAPDSSTGPVTFYYSGNLGDGYGAISGQPNAPYPDGDSIFTGSMTLYPGPSSVLGINSLAGNISSISVYPVPFGQELSANVYLSTSAHVSVTLLSLEGQAVRELYNGDAAQGHFSRTFDIADVAAGIYFVRIQAGTDTKTLKVLKY